VADKDPSFLRQIRDHLERLSYPITTVGDRQELDDALRSAGQVADVLVVDVRLLGGDVPGTVHRFATDHPRLDLVVTTGYLTMEQSVLALEAGAFDLITKPPVWACVGRTIDIVTGWRSTRQAPEVPVGRGAAPSPPGRGSVDAAIASYEFLTGMVPSFGYMELLVSGKLGPLSQEQQDAALIVRQGLTWARRHIHGHITTAAADPSSLPVHREPVEVSALMEWAAEMFRPLAYEAGVEITFHQPPAITISVDRDRLILILFSLVHNAVQHTRAGGEVVLALTQESERVVICVSDNGTGIPEEYQERIFDPFFKVPGSAGPDMERGGLGLACARLNAILLEALLKVRSTPGQGSTFALALPRTPVGE
jgi:CheY-like chemotaxis protein